MDDKVAKFLDEFASMMPRELVSLKDALVRAALDAESPAQAFDAIIERLLTSQHTLNAAIIKAMDARRGL